MRVLNQYFFFVFHCHIHFPIRISTNIKFGTHSHANLIWKCAHCAMAQRIWNLALQQVRSVSTFCSQWNVLENLSNVLKTWIQTQRISNPMDRKTNRPLCFMWSIFSNRREAAGIFLSSNESVEFTLRLRVASGQHAVVTVTKLWSRTLQLHWQYSIRLTHVPWLSLCEQNVCECESLMHRLERFAQQYKILFFQSHCTTVYDFCPFRTNNLEYFWYELCVNSSHSHILRLVKQIWQMCLFIDTRIRSRIHTHTHQAEGMMSCTYGEKWHIMCKKKIASSHK